MSLYSVLYMRIFFSFCSDLVCLLVSFRVIRFNSVVKVDQETRRYYRLLKNRGARLFNTGLKKSQTHSYPAHIL